MKIAGVELKDAGYKPEPGKGGPETLARTVGGDEKQYPSLYVDDKEMPGILDKDYGDTCVLVAIVKVQRDSKEEVKEDGKKSTRRTMNLKIIKAGLKNYKEQTADDLSDDELREKIKDAATTE
jgi:hypothetical protein